MSNRSKIEIYVHSVQEAVQAQKAGAHRIILCAGSAGWGTTPSFGSIRIARQQLDAAELYVLVCPHSGNFLHTPLEQEVMLHDVKVARQLGADGVVFGCLTPSGQIDEGLVKKLMNAVGEMKVTFHHAFNLCDNREDALEQLVGLGIQRVHVSIPTDFIPFLSLMKAWNESSEGRIQLVPCGGVTTGNLVEIASQTGCREFNIQSDEAPASLVSDAITSEVIPQFMKELDRVNEIDAAMEKLLKEAKTKKKKGRKSEDDDEEE